jgi:hypothetical protein
MKRDEFKQNYTLDRTAKGVRGLRKGESAYPVAATADGRPFDHAATYHFFDGSRVRSTEGLRRIDAEHLGSMGMRIVEIAKLRAVRDDALVDAQKHCLDKIEELRQKIRGYEDEKEPKRRTMKYVLMSNN